MTQQDATHSIDHNRLIKIAAGIGLAGGLVCVVGAFVDPARFYFSYLVALQFWLGLSLGSMVILMLQYITGGRWGVLLRGVLAAALTPLPLMAILFVPLFFGLNHVYIWTDTEYMLGDHHLQHKVQYLSIPWFLARTALYFAAWLVLAWFLYRGTQKLATKYDADTEERMRTVSAPGILIYSVVITFAAVDWIMSLEPKWYSTIFGALIAVSQILPAFAFAIAALALNADRQNVREAVTPNRWKDYGNLLLAFVMIWAYISYSQFFLIWAGNLPEETVWYARRIQGGWEYLGWALMLLNVALPFMLLLSSDLKRNPKRLIWVTGIILIMHYVHQYWNIMPVYPITRGYTSREVFTTIQVSWIDPFTWLAVGGLWCACFLWRLHAAPLVPAPHPALEKEDHHG